MMKLIIYTIVSLISTFGFSYLYYKLSESKNKISKRAIIIFVIGFIIFAFIKYFNIPFLDFAAYFILYPLLFYNLGNYSLKRTIYYTLIIWVYGVILDFCCMIVLSILSYHNIINLENDIYILLPTIILFAIFILLANCPKIKKFTTRIYNLISKIKYSDFLLIGFTIFVIAAGITITTNIHNLNIELIIFLLSFQVLIIFILLLSKKFSEFENEKFLELLKENNDFYIQVEEENRILKHNLVAKLLSIKSVSNKSAKLLIDELITEFNKDYKFNNCIKDIPYGLNGIIYQKIYPYLGKIYIEIDNDISDDIFKKLNPKRYNELIEKLNIALDNAIESCTKSNDKTLSINISENDIYINIEIENTFNSCIDLDKLGKINYSTKGLKRGLGLFSILRTKDVITEIKIINNIFILKLTCKKLQQ